MARVVKKRSFETLEKQADKALLQAYCGYLIKRLDNIENQEIEMIDELKQHAKTDKQIEQFNYMIAMEVNLYKWVKCKILSAYYDEVLNVDTYTALYLAECEGRINDRS